MITAAKVSTALFVPQTVESAPEKSKPILQNVNKAFGFIPNLMATFANNPSVLEGYLALDSIFEKGSFTRVERQLILLAVSVENKCAYCTAAHSTIAKGFCTRRRRSSWQSATVRRLPTRRRMRWSIS